MTAISAATSFAGIAREQMAMRAYAADKNRPSPPPSRYRGSSNGNARNRLRGRGQRCGYAHPVYVHQHAEYPHAECPHCYYRSLITDSLTTYHTTRRQLRATYIWNLQQLRALHASQPHKPPRAKADEVDRLYAYYVARVRDAFEDRQRHITPGVDADALYWEPPEREVDPREEVAAVAMMETSSSSPPVAEEEETEEEQGGGGGGGEKKKKKSSTSKKRLGERERERDRDQRSVVETMRSIIASAARLGGRDNEESGSVGSGGSRRRGRSPMAVTATTATGKKSSNKGKGKRRAGRSSLSDYESYGGECECGEEV
ncbi:hypothetical protein F4779DRAFT_634780 [Xylariaceae sp. FL0662B]|nr:hypothetical protein F4779DRAFT_634780 [Xylariaceae sp. FL0662B]